MSRAVATLRESFRRGSLRRRLIARHNRLEAPMTKTFCMTALAALALRSAVQAQPFRGGSATLYDQPNFQGNSVTITQSAPDLGKWRFNDRAQSARFEGRWLIC